MLHGERHYTRSESEKGFDDEMRGIMLKSGTKAEMALYIQNQAILSMLRHIDDMLCSLTKQ